MAEPNTLRVRVVHGFVIGPGQATEPGQVIELDRHFAMLMLNANKVVVEPPPAPEPEPAAAPVDDEATDGDPAEAAEKPSRRSRT